MRRALLSLVFLVAWARAESPAAADIPPPPKLPPALEDSREDPEIRIVEEKPDVTRIEYRLRGKLYMVKIVPKVGKPYYLIDEEGKGSFTPRDEILGPRISVPQWVLFEF